MTKITQTCLLSVLMMLVFVNSSYARLSHRKAGDYAQYINLFGAIATTFAKRDSEGFKQFAVGMGSSLIFMDALKHTVYERRPNGNDFLSFPSGHMVWASSPAAFMQLRYGWHYGLPAYIIAGYVGYTRVHAKAHFTHDVLAGAALTFVLNYFLTTPYQSKNIKAQLMPEVSPEHKGLRLELSWN